MATTSDLSSLRVAATWLGKHDPVFGTKLSTFINAAVVVDKTFQDAHRRFEELDPSERETDTILIDHMESLNTHLSIFAGATVGLGAGIVGSILTGGAATAGIVGTTVQLALAIGLGEFGSYLSSHGFRIVSPSEIGTAQSELIIGNPLGGKITLLGGNDVFIANALNQSYQIYGDGGDDKIVAGKTGLDWVYGGKGNDIVIATDSARQIHGDAGNDWLQGGYRGDYVFGGRDSDTILGGAGRDVLYGADQNINITNTFPISDQDFIMGGGGSDILTGGRGNDILVGDNFADSASAGNTLASFKSALKGKYTGDSEAGEGDQLVGLSGNDIIAGGAGGDLVWGDDAPASSSVVVITGIGNDSLYGDAGNDTIHGGWGDDSIYGGVNDDWLYDSFNYRGLKLPSGQTDNDRIYGGANNDRIFLTEGNDTVDGGAGTDELQYLHKHGMAFVFSDDAAALTPLVKAHDSFNIATGKILDTENFDSIRNIENLQGTAYDDLYIIKSGVDSIADISGHDSYFLDIKSLWNGSTTNDVSITDKDAELTLKLQGADTVKGVAFLEWHDIGSANPWAEVWIENASGTMSKTTKSGDALDYILENYYIGDKGYDGIGLGKVNSSLADGFWSTLNLSNGDIHIHGGPSGGGPGGRYSGYTGPSYHIDLDFGTGGPKDLFALFSGQKLNFNVKTQSFEFDLFG